MSFSNISFILHKPQLSENIGACARAIKNFNFNKLILINPKPSFPNDKIIATSVGAHDIIKKSKVFNNLEPALKNIDYLIATTSRFRNKNVKHIQLNSLKKIDFKKKIAIVFGPEASGLTNNELSYANYLIKLPTNNNFKSLNLSHCVILICYEIFKILNKKNNRYKSRYKSKLINKKDLNKFVNFLISSLDQIGFLQPYHKRKSMIENIRTIFHKMNLSDKEMRILLGIFASLKDKKVD